MDVISEYEERQKIMQEARLWRDNLRQTLRPADYQQAIRVEGVTDPLEIDRIHSQRLRDERAWTVEGQQKMARDERTKEFSTMVRDSRTLYMKAMGMQYVDGKATKVVTYADFERETDRTGIVLFPPPWNYKPFEDRFPLRCLQVDTHKLGDEVVRTGLGFHLMEQLQLQRLDADLAQQLVYRLQYLFKRKPMEMATLAGEVNSFTHGFYVSYENCWAVADSDPHCHQKLFGYLIKCGAKIDCTLLKAAIGHGAVHQVQELVRFGALQIEEGREDWVALAEAIYQRTRAYRQSLDSLQYTGNHPNPVRAEREFMDELPRRKKEADKGCRRSEATLNFLRNPLLVPEVDEV